MEHERKARQGMDLLKESVLDVISRKGEAGYMDIARSIPALEFDSEKKTHKGWFVSAIVRLLAEERKVEKIGRKWRVIK